MAPYIPSYGQMTLAMTWNSKLSYGQNVEAYWMSQCSAGENATYDASACQGITKYYGWGDFKGSKIDEAVQIAGMLLGAVGGGEGGLEADEAEAWRIYGLGADPAIGGKIRWSEVDTASRIESELGVKLTRAPRDSSADWVDENGKTYDAVGNFPGRHFDAQWDAGAFQRQIVRHLEKAQVVPVDVSRFSPEQIDKVVQYVEELNNPGVVIIGA
ncbi:hypothetical protein ACFQZC_00670 [Streptacidiphilus monticola]